MIKFHLEQGSAEWLEFRKGKISSSKVPIILGQSPYQTAFELWEEELGLREPQGSSPHMKKGLAIEEAARQWYLEETGYRVTPAVITSEQHPDFMASLDGLNEEKKIIVEIKNNNSDWHEQAKKGEVPYFHLLQCQNHMLVAGSGYDECHYISYRPGDSVMVVVKRDENLMDEIVKKGIEFKKMVDNLVAPPLTDRDYVDMSQDSELADNYSLYHYYVSMQKDYESKADIVKQKIIDKAGSRSIKGYGFKLTKYETKGRVDYEKLVSESCPGVDVEKYRSDSKSSYRLTAD